MPPSRPATEEWDMEKMKAWLEDLQKRADGAHGAESSTFIYPRVLTWSTDHQKTEWTGYLEGAGDRDTFAKLGKAKKGGRQAWCAVVDGHNQSYVGKPSRGSGQQQWDFRGAHMWGTAVISEGVKGKGKAVLIYDCDAELPAKGEKYHAKDLRTQLQRVFVNEAKK